jgi:hypothetical protein
MKKRIVNTDGGPLEVREIEMESLVLPQVGIMGFKSFKDLGYLIDEVEEGAFWVSHVYENYGYKM